jgi:hypothetical protein
MSSPVWRGALTIYWHDFIEKKGTISWLVDLIEFVNIFLQVSEKYQKIFERMQVHDRICTRSKPDENLALKITCSICQAILTSKMLNL